MKRPILIALIGYLIGILWGLYFKISIVFLFIVTYCLYQLLKISMRKRIRNTIRYIRVFITWKVIIIIITSAVIANTIVINLNYRYKNIYNNISEGNFIATVVSSKKVKKYNTEYKIKVESINKDKKYKNTYLLLNISIKDKIILEYGDKIQFKGEYIKPNIQRNYKGFDYSKYLRSINVYGNVKASNVNILEKNKGNLLGSITNKVSRKIENTYEKLLPNENSRNLILGILLGQDDNLNKEIKENFADSSLSHILAVSGMHVSYVILGISLVLSKFPISKNVFKLIAIFILIFFMYLTNLSPSVVRAGIMGILALGAHILYRKSDITTSISIALLIILICNPYSIMNIGLILSFFGTIGIIMLYKNIVKIFNKKDIHHNKIYEKIKEIVAVSISAQIYIFPIIMLYFNKISITFLFSNLLVSFIIGTIIILGFLVIIVSIKFITVAKALSAVLNLLLELLIIISNFFSKLPLSKITVTTPNIGIVLIYYICITFISYMQILKKSNMRYTQKKLLTFVYNIKMKILNKKKLLITIFILIIILNYIYNRIPKDLQIHFIDVGQGDSSLIITPSNKKILIDGGGSKEREEFDVGKSTLLPYLLDRKISKIDYMMISHFDADHSQGLTKIIEELKVKNVIIGKQFEISENYKEFVELVKMKNIKVNVVEAGSRINIEKDLYIDILWPDSANVIRDNVLNNNSLVCKIVYKKFSMLFTGDIEEKAENAILKKYTNNLEMLNGAVLKVAHHGSKTSSTTEFLRAVSPEIALIGVRKK